MLSLTYVRIGESLEDDNFRKQGRLDDKPLVSRRFCDAILLMNKLAILPCIFVEEVISIESKGRCLFENTSRQQSLQRPLSWHLNQQVFTNFLSIICSLLR